MRRERMRRLRSLLVLDKRCVPKFSALKTQLAKSLLDGIVSLLDYKALSVCMRWICKVPHVCR